MLQKKCKRKCRLWRWCDGDRIGQEKGNKSKSPWPKEYSRHLQSCYYFFFHFFSQNQWRVTRMVRVVRQAVQCPVSIAIYWVWLIDEFDMNTISLSEWMNVSIAAKNPVELVSQLPPRWHSIHFTLPSSAGQQHLTINKFGIRVAIKSKRVRSLVEAIAKSSTTTPAIEQNGLLNTVTRFQWLCRIMLRWCCCNEQWVAGV